MKDTLCFQDFRTVKNYDICITNNIGNRTEQQDSIYTAVSDKEVFSVLCDGMGGMNSGKLAAITSRDAFIEFCQFYQNKYAGWMQKSVEAVDRTVFNLSDEQGTRLSCGSTIVSIYIDTNELQWISVGDSRLYIIRGDQFVQVTTDHNYFYDLNTRLNNGLMSQEEYLKELVNGDQLISYLGLGGLQLVDMSTNPFMLIKNDLIFMCSDGVYKSVEKDILTKTLTSGKTVEEIGQEIITIISKLQDENQDNYSFIIVKKLF